MSIHLGAETRASRSLPLDGLRGLACIGIVFLHGHYGGLLYWFWTLVDLFFVLSGFLISRVILRGLHERSFSLRNFMIQRALRVWPVYYLTLIACMTPIFCQFLATGIWEEINGVFSSPFFLQFTFYYLEPGMNGPQVKFIPSFHHSWSLAVEEQFYLLLPLLLLALRHRMAAVVAVLLGCVVAAVYFRYLDIVRALLLARMDALAIGVLLGLYWVYVEERSRAPRLKIRQRHALCLASLAASLIAFYFLVPVLGDRLPAGVAAWRTALGLLGFNLFYGVLLLALLKQWLPWLSKGISWAPFVWFGAISYALYMFHLPVRGVLIYLEDVVSIKYASLWAQVAYFVLPVVLAALSKQFIEEPVARLKHYFPLYRKAVAPVSAANVVA